GDERHVAHELIALGPGIAAEHFQLSLECGQTENCIERSCLAGAVRPDDSENPALFDPKIDMIQRDSCAEHFAQTARFNADHASASPFQFSLSDAPPRRAILLESNRAAGSSRGPAANVRSEIFGARLLATNRAPRFGRTCRDRAVSPPTPRRLIPDTPSER